MSSFGLPIADAIDIEVGNGVKKAGLILRINPRLAERVLRELPGRRFLKNSAERDEFFGVEIQFDPSLSDWKLERKNV